MRTIGYIVPLIAGAMVVMACGSSHAEENAEYVATLSPLNVSVTGSKTEGEATFVRHGDSLTITVDVKGSPPGIAHLQHFHGFATGTKVSKCPDAAADTNGDGIIDLVETEPLAGTTMVPFTGDPISMAIPSDSYPKASSDGSYHYQKTVSWKALQAAFAKKFPGQQLDLTRRVVFIHTVNPKANLPKTVASLPGVPASVTLPIACGAIRAK